LNGIHSHGTTVNYIFVKTKELSLLFVDNPIGVGLSVYENEADIP